MDLTRFEGTCVLASGQSGERVPIAAIVMAIVRNCHIAASGSACFARNRPANLEGGHYFAGEVVRLRWMRDDYDRQDVSPFVHFASIPFSVARLGDTMRVRFVGRWDGRWPFVARGKSGLHRVQWWVTPTLGNGWYSRCQSPTGGTVQQKVNRRAESAFRKVRVKRCGAQALNVRAHQRRGDPSARQTPLEARPSRGEDRPDPFEPRVGCSIARVTVRLEK